MNDIIITAGIGKSHHFVMLISLNCAYEVSPRLSRLNFSKTDIIMLRQQLAENDWDTELSGKTVSEAWLYLKEAIQQAVTKSTPKTKSSGRRGKSWMDPDTLGSVRRKHHLFRKWQKIRTRYILYKGKKTK